MYTPAELEGFVRQFQEEELSANADYSVLEHTRSHLHNKLLQRKYFLKQLQLLYAQLDKTRNYQEFVDTLIGNRELLREIFVLDRQEKLVSPTVEWSKYGVDVEAYLMEHGNRQLVNESGWVFKDM
ncbi:LAFE_0C00892g1_1 [Lachancea fermentati]|uniref:LAFE_0C00892g1_1 n=1 Tax=Lachancea fermentati TaxID=4955 RepID=A0A1G4M8Z1_LACFM|nr:LAFE_0C00892g1_1 [Lachancea fermentati]